MHFTYLPSLICPSCNIESEYIEVESSARYPEGTECPRCGEIVPTKKYLLKHKWRCSECGSDVILNDCIDNGDGTFGCPNCSCDGDIVSDIQRFEQFYRDGENWYSCPYCKTEFPASDLIPDGKGEVIFCPVCGRAGEI
jgi:DNA-directed RNA polymerase subunit RPC12/RpoP